ncbi:MAG: hypothetical protein Q9M36_13865 [Sulfurovum sp.]|nr:hypothetical protein [Sulfurovum sp.]
MKKIFITALLTTLALLNLEANSNSVETCKNYISEAKSFQSTMHNDKISQATMVLYKEKVVAHCGNIVASLPYKKEFFVKELVKKDTQTVAQCKLAIQIAKAYTNNDKRSTFMAQTHKENMIDNCGNLVAQKTPAFCLFDKVADSTDVLKERCITAIQDAHKTVDVKQMLTHKKAIVFNCGKLHEQL